MQAFTAGAAEAAGARAPSGGSVAGGAAAAADYLRAQREARDLAIAAEDVDRRLRKLKTADPMPGPLSEAEMAELLAECRRNQALEPAMPPASPL